MTYVLAFLAAIAGAAGGALLGGVIGAALAPAFGISSFEGAAGYFVVFVCAPIGGLRCILFQVLATHNRAEHRWPRRANR